MFEDSLFASTARPNRRRGLAAVLSFAFQALVLSIFVLLPLIYTNALPVNLLKPDFILSPPVRTAAPPGPAIHSTHPVSTNLDNGHIVAPIVIPPHPAILREDRELGNGGGDPGSYIPGAIPIGDGANNRAIQRVLGLTPPIAPPPASVSHGPLYISHLNEGLLIRKVAPAYPKLAMIAHQQGSVILEATIARDGSIENLRAVSGPPLLLGAAIDAVRQWRYRPYLLNNQAVEVETQITVNFVLGQ